MNEMDQIGTITVVNLRVYINSRRYLEETLANFF